MSYTSKCTKTRTRIPTRLAEHSTRLLKLQRADWLNTFLLYALEETQTNNDLKVNTCFNSGYYHIIVDS